RPVGIHSLPDVRRAPLQGAWVGSVNFALSAGAGAHRIDLNRQLVPVAALSPRSPIESPSLQRWATCSRSRIASRELG
ncbi:MAG: hypothetical protein M3R09_11495, partial [Actinomycetota bacterium]|nr:hypothetical protein [Actinomycetota bacterium]